MDCNQLYLKNIIEETKPSHSLDYLIPEFVYSGSTSQAVEASNVWVITQRSRIWRGDLRESCERAGGAYNGRRTGTGPYVCCMLHVWRMHVACRGREAHTTEEDPAGLIASKSKSQDIKLDWYGVMQLWGEKLRFGF